MANLRGIAIILLLLISSLIFPLEFDDSADDSESLEVEIVDNYEKPSDDSISDSSRAARPAQDDAHGGEWVDSFEDDSEIDWGLSDHLKVEEGDAGINGSEIFDSHTKIILHFDEGSGTTAYDSTRYKNDGTLGGDGVGTDLPTWTSTAKYGNALDFDGVDDYVSTPLNIDQSSSSPGLTMCCWVYPLTSTSWNRHMVITSDDDGYDWSITIYRNEWVIFTGSTYWNTGFNMDVNTWQYVAAVFIPGTGTKFYKNGVGVSSSSLGYDTIDREIWIGSHPKYNQRFDGIVDEVYVAITPRSAEYIKDIYENGTNRNFGCGNLTSKAISLPPNMHWDTLMIDKTEPDKTYLNVTVLNATTNQPIPGSPTYTDNGEVDISYIDPIQYPSIKLNATFESDGSTTPELHSWAVSWNRSNTWQDTLFGGEKVESSENVEAVDGNVQLKQSGIDSSAVAMWHFDEGSGTTAYDETDNDNDGTINGATWTTGKYGKALSFDGVDDYISILPDPSLTVPNKMTIGAWVKPIGLGGYQAIMTRNFGAGGPGGSHYGFRFQGTTLDGGISDTDYRFWVAGMGSFSNGNWYHIILTFDESKNHYEIYSNGNTLSSGPLTPISYNEITGNLNIGRDNRNMDYFNGIIDEVTIYDRALSALEVKDIYENGTNRNFWYGNLTSTPITLPPNMCWDTLRINKTEPQDTSLNVTILDADSDQPITSFQNLTGINIDISSINPILHSPIKL